MTLQKPFDINIRGRTIDGNESNEVSWKVSGDVSTAYKIDILMNSDNSLVWTSNKITSYALKHTIPSSSLLNGNELKVIVTIWNQANQSISSDGEIFQTSAKPVVTVNPIGAVGSFSYNFSANYTQEQGDTLRNYIVLLYDEDQNLIEKSNIKSTLPMEHLFSNLQTEKKYFVEFQATSSKGLIGASGKVSFDVFYYRPKMSVNLQGKNIENAGVELSWFVSQIIGQTDGSQFIDNDKIDTTDGTKVWFDEGFSIDVDFSLKLWVDDPQNKVDLLILNGDNGQIKLQYHLLDEKFHLYKTLTNGLTTEWISSVVTGNSFIVLIQQIGNAMNLIAQLND